MHQELHQLKQLVLNGSYDEDSIRDVAALEQRLHEIAAKEAVAQNPHVAPFIAYCQGEIDRCELLLKTDRKLTDVERAELFARIDIASHLTSLFAVESQRKEVEKTIKHYLDVAKDL